MLHELPKNIFIRIKYVWQTNLLVNDFFFIHYFFSNLIIYFFHFSKEQRFDINNRPYFVNHKNHTTQWEDPRIQGREVAMLPDEWEIRYTDKGQRYFVDHKNKTTTSEDPRYTIYLFSHKLFSTIIFVIYFV